MQGKAENLKHHHHHSGKHHGKKSHQKSANVLSRDQVKELPPDDAKTLIKKMKSNWGYKTHH
jgi:hypothetical protein